MAENNTKEISRRDFLKKAGKYVRTAGVGAIIGTVMSNEINKGINGVHTDVGIFVPLYEKHTTGINEEDIPSDTKIFFREVAFGEDDSNSFLRVSPAEILFAGGVAYNNIYEIVVRPLPDQILNKLASINAEIMLGDVTSPDNTSNDKALTDLSHFYEALLASGSLLLFASVIPEKPSKISRRKILRSAGYAAVGFGASAIGADVLGVITMNEGKQQDALKRILARIEGMISDFHPENSNIFFRNAIMAYKMLTVARTYKNMPKVTFQVESGHSGIEDFLQLGADGTKAIILAHPKSFLEEWVKANGGIESFCASRLIKMPTSFRAVNGEIEDKMKNAIKDRTVVDSELKRGLEQILQKAS